MDWLGLQGGAGHVVHVQVGGILVPHRHAQIVGEQQPRADAARQVAVVEEGSLWCSSRGSEPGADVGVSAIIIVQTGCIFRRMGRSRNN